MPVGNIVVGGSLQPSLEVFIIAVHGQFCCLNFNSFVVLLILSTFYIGPWKKKGTKYGWIRDLDGADAPRGSRRKSLKPKFSASKSKTKAMTFPRSSCWVFTA